MIDPNLPVPAVEPYRTPLAGESVHADPFGRRVNLPGRDRENEASLALGGTLFATSLAGQDLYPIAAVYWKHRWDDTRCRAVLGVFVNELDASHSIERLQLLGHLDNDTIPFPDREIAEGREVKNSSLIWGTVNGRLGAGYSMPVHPFQVDNNLRLQLYGQLGYLFSKRTADTGPDQMLPPDTAVYGSLARVRYDGLRRNLLELPHQGFAAGMDAELMHRDRWSDANYGGVLYPVGETRDYMKLSGYALAATGIPGLSEKNRLLLGFYGGCNPYGRLDRFSAFRLGGGPIPTESDDLDRQVYPGAMINQFPVSDYLIGSLEYRRELYFFLYLHLRFTYAWVNRNVFTDPLRRFAETNGQAVSAAVTSGFLWDSQIYLEYSYDTSILRNGTPGGTLLLLWSKGF